MELGAIAHWTSSQKGRRKLRYSAASLTSAVVGQALLAVAFGGFRWPARSANLFAWGMASLTSYHLSRAWVWRQEGRSHPLREVLPFCVLALTGLAVSTLAVELAESFTSGSSMSHGFRTVVIMLASLSSFFGVWILKYLILDRLVFVHDAAGPAAAAKRRPAGPSLATELAPAVDSRIVGE